MACGASDCLVKKMAWQETGYLSRWPFGRLQVVTCLLQVGLPRAPGSHVISVVVSAVLSCDTTVGIVRL